jgi:nicotinate-nucleotide adenylyltransferase
VIPFSLGITSLSGRSENPKIGVFGGTFDPPHLGHMILAQEAHQQLGLEKVYFVLTATPPHKRDHEVSPVEFRVNLVEAAIQDNEYFVLSRVDIDRPPPHYSVDTVKILSAREPGVTWIYLMGGDSLVELPKWHDPIGFVNACDGLGVIRRPDDDVDLETLAQAIPDIRDKIFFVDAPLLEISSSGIRDRVRRSLPYRYYVLPAVFELIQKLGLYLKL